MLLCLVHDHLHRSSSLDVLAASLKGPCTAVNRLAHTNVVSNGASFHFLRMTTKGQNAGGVDTARDGCDARFQAKATHVVVELAALGVDPRGRVKVPLAAVDLQLGLQLSVHWRGHSLFVVLFA